ncbi:Protein phosphatase methylesterase 1 [Cyphellophora attinorum]|uniref:Protein phosphatase methylesterase 1 n=1 Tax=Cyphellophora attinorum TaxID=1664694 RepID=A0A0N1HUE2_9EURO|nr:Protein phosphatase methylesterase 1 [Phialophora attinorum]KPI42985.1 Protein phosphatase methylesterase 1 [Phialophora attinorum]
MSDLQRSFAKAHISKPPPRPLSFNDVEEEDDDDLTNLRPTSPNDSSSSASSASSTGTIVPSPSQNLFERPKASTIKSRSAPLPWQDYFGQELFFPNPHQPDLIHHAYLTPPSSNGPLIVTHHGAGSSGLSFAAFFAELTKTLPTAGILSLDARDHGLTTTPDNLPLDLTLPTLAADLAASS